jgi:FkbM family methyltransferase
MRDNSIQKLNHVERVATYSKFQRFLNHPIKYALAIGFRTIIYPIVKKEWKLKASLFFGKEMLIALPAATDIFLTGGKSHDSEIRLARFLINNLKVHDVFFDIGAHYGYFSLLAAELIDNEGAVYSFEPSSKSYTILSANVQQHKKIYSYHLAIANKEELLSFYEFPNLYSEYNALDVHQFEKEQWFAQYIPKKHDVQATSIDTFVKKNNIQPTFFKIDVEGAEHQVIQGAANFLQENEPVIVMEYLAAARDNQEHTKAHLLLSALNYASYIIDKDGVLIRTEAIDRYLEQQGLESDNIVYRKVTNV